MSSTTLPEGWAAPPPATPYRPQPAASTLVVPVAAALGVVGVLGGYVVARYGGLDPLLLAGLLWWTGSAVVLSLLARRSTWQTAVVTLFLFTFVAVPAVVYAAVRGTAERAVAVFTDQLEDFGEQFGEQLGSGLGG